MPGTLIMSRHAYLKTLLTGKAIDRPEPSAHDTELARVGKPVVIKPDPGIQAQDHLAKERERKARSRTHGT